MEDDLAPSILVANVAEAIVAAAAPSAERLAVFRRRWNRAINDVGLGGVLRDWASIGDDSVELAPLTFEQADHLLRWLEDAGRMSARRPMASRVDGWGDPRVLDAECE